jgi:uncharacterized damage-inducible protein DinB
VIAKLAERENAEMPNRFEQLAAYNSWANARLYDAACALPEDLYRADVGVFFHSLHGTLNHLLLTDRLWLTRLTGSGEQPKRLDQILFEDRDELRQARTAEDERLRKVVGDIEESALADLHTYHTTSGVLQQQPMFEILLHLFNHQTHHRGQAHACLSIVSREPPSLDLLMFQRILKSSTANT